MALFKRLLRLLYPDRCVLCGEVAAAGEFCCPRCPQPGLRPREQGEVLAPFRYLGEVRGAVSRFKFQGDFRVGRYLAREMAQLLRQTFPTLPFDCIAYVPMPPEREKRRGYNQAQLLAEELSRRTGLPVQPGLLVREGVFAQHQLAAGFRKKGARYTFFADEGLCLQGKRVVLVDDIVTTGETVRVCAGLLEKMGAAAVTILAAAK